MIAIPFTLTPPLVGGLTSATNTTAPTRHRLPDFFEELSGTPIVSGPTARRFRGDCAPLPQARPARRLDPCARSRASAPSGKIHRMGTEFADKSAEMFRALADGETGTFRSSLRQVFQLSPRVP